MTNMMQTLEIVGHGVSLEVACSGDLISFQYERLGRLPAAVLAAIVFPPQFTMIDLCNQGLTDKALAALRLPDTVRYLDLSDNPQMTVDGMLGDWHIPSHLCAIDIRNATRWPYTVIGHLLARAPLLRRCTPALRGFDEELARRREKYDTRERQRLSLAAAVLLRDAVGAEAADTGTSDRVTVIIDTASDEYWVWKELLLRL